ncbi:MAG: hypothetical protein AABY92_03590, partial [Thermodesulfobacteriota bacterium]
MVRAFPVRQTFPDMFLRGRGRLRGVLLPAVLLLALSSCRCQEQLPPDYLVALVNGERINLSEYQARMADETALVKSAPPL